MELLSFSVGATRYALPIVDVIEVQRAVAITPIPNAPALVEGALNLRGTVVPVLDLRRRLRQPPVPIAPDQHFIVARAGSRLVAIRADAGTTLVDVDEATVAHPLDVTGDDPFVRGVVAREDGVLVIHDLAHFLSTAESAALAHALAAAAPPVETDAR